MIIYHNNTFMGIKNLNTLLEQFAKNGINKTHLSKYSGLTFAIDANIYLYKYLYGNSNHLDGIFFQVNKFTKRKRTIKKKRV